MDNSTIISILEKVSRRGTCQKRKVGCVIIRSSKVLLTAANGMPNGLQLSCEGGDCPRCKKTNKFKHGLYYDLCFCLHAEERAIANAAKKGISLEGAILYSSYQPCIMCIKQIFQSGIIGIRYLESWNVPEPGIINKEELQCTYNLISNSFPLGNKKLQ